MPIKIFQRTDLISRIQDLHLPVGEYVVFGSAPLAAHGIRPTRDIDILVTTKLYNQLKKNDSWQENEWNDGGYYLSKGEIEIVYSWNYGNYRAAPEEIISKAEMIEGIPFVPLKEVLKWKEEFGRDKDREDIKLIMKHLNSSQ